MSDFERCPLFIAGGCNGEDTYCITYRCAWWDDKNKCCAILGFVRSRTPAAPLPIKKDFTYATKDDTENIKTFKKGQVTW